MPGLLPTDDIQALRDALLSADYTSDGIAGRLGPDTTAAVERNDFRAALKVTEDRDPLATFIRLYVCGQTEPVSSVRRAFKDLSLEAALDAELIVRTDDGYSAGVDCEPYRVGSGGPQWILADLPAGTRPGPLMREHVLGVGGASTTLANAIVRKPVRTALDLGTGCGVQALHLSEHSDRVVATDVSERALRFAATTARLSGLEWDLRRGDMLVPVEGERFDLIVSNPPFVVGPGTSTHTYRDSGRPGDAISAELAKAAERYLTPNGTIQFLANWLHVIGEDWAERVSGWFAGTGMDVWIIQREVSDPMSYVDLWLNDAGQSDPHRAAAWLDWFDAHKVEAVGFGLVTARNSQSHDPVVRAETLRQPLAQPFGPEVAKWFDRQDWLRTRSVDELLDTRYLSAPGLTLHQEAERGADGWDVTRQSLTQTEGLGWSEEIDPVLLAIVGGCDGSVTLRDQLAILAAAYDEPASTLNMMAAVIVPHLIERAFLTPAP
jgi:methylase of polypeptide subunit release factors